jgi:hypothetical protein
MNGLAWQGQARKVPVAATAVGGAASLASIWEASARRTKLLDNSFSADASLDEAYTQRIEAIRAATGVVLENPVAQADAKFNLDAEVPRAFDDFASYGSRSELRADFTARFNARLSELAEQFPQARADIGAGRSLEADAEDIARQSDERLATLMASNPGWGAFGANLGGAVMGSLDDPVQVASLFAGGGAGVAKTIGGRVLAVAVREAAINGAVEASLQPSVQAWRKKLGLPNGFGEGLANVGLAAGFGGVFGGIVQGGREAVRGVRRLGPAARDTVAEQLAGGEGLNGDLRAAMAGDGDAAGRVLPEIREALDPEARGALDAVEASKSERAVLDGLDAVPDDYDTKRALAARAADGNPEALAELTASDDALSEVGPEPAAVRAFDQVREDDGLDGFDFDGLDEETLAMPVLDENGDMVPLADMMERANRDEGLGALVEACLA